MTTVGSATDKKVDKISGKGLDNNLKNLVSERDKLAANGLDVTLPSNITQDLKSKFATTLKNINDALDPATNPSSKYDLIQLLSDIKNKKPQLTLMGIYNCFGEQKKNDELIERLAVLLKLDLNNYDKKEIAVRAETKQKSIKSIRGSNSVALLQTIEQGEADLKDPDIKKEIGLRGLELIQNNPQVFSYCGERFNSLRPYLGLALTSGQKIVSLNDKAGKLYMVVLEQQNGKWDIAAGQTKLFGDKTYVTPDGSQVCQRGFLKDQKYSVSDVSLSSNGSSLMTGAAGDMTALINIRFVQFRERVSVAGGKVNVDGKEVQNVDLSDGLSDAEVKAILKALGQADTLTAFDTIRDSGMVKGGDTDHNTDQKEAQKAVEVVDKWAQLKYGALYHSNNKEEALKKAALDYVEAADFEMADIDGALTRADGDWKGIEADVNESTTVGQLLNKPVFSGANKTELMTHISTTFKINPINDTTLLSASEANAQKNKEAAVNIAKDLCYYYEWLKLVAEKKSDAAGTGASNPEASNPSTSLTEAERGEDVEEASRRGLTIESYRIGKQADNLGKSTKTMGELIGEYTSLYSRAEAEKDNMSKKPVDQRTSIESQSITILDEAVQELKSKVILNYIKPAIVEAKDKKGLEESLTKVINIRDKSNIDDDFKTQINTVIINDAVERLNKNNQKPSQIDKDMARQLANALPNGFKINDQLSKDTLLKFIIGNGGGGGIVHPTIKYDTKDLQSSLSRIQ